MARNFSQYVDDDGSEDEMVLTALPEMEPIEGGDITLHSLNRGTVGNLHYLPNERAIAYCSTKGTRHKMNKFSGYAVSTKLFEKISAQVRSLIDEHDLDIDDAAPIYFIFFERETRDGLVFTLEQYRDEGTEINYTDEQHVLSVSDAKSVLSNALNNVVRTSDYPHGYISE